ncbi:hypothetical protein [Vibrio fluvialis]|uniref:hypothetical protein n=1 Tax=Vibrio fluvialis TaxID=676 RepID=UPI001F26CBDB|nr:hypothetical protein [Vibrio fluvialis]MCE7622109.1 hypothetical protein [Vibrio fluvialis]
MEFQQIDVTGCRIVGAIDKMLGHAGPKHHGVILGINLDDDKVYIAESMHFGYQLSTYEDFYARYSQNGEIAISPNDGNFENIAVANRALHEINQGGKGVYNLITNNCECFVNRAMHNNSRSQQIINTGIGLLALAGLVYVIKKSK